MNKKKLKILLIIILYNFVNGSEKAPNCTIKNSGESGTCIDINDCQPILKEVRLGIRNYTLCDKRNGIGYICCPDQKSLKKCQEYSKLVYEYKEMLKYNERDGTIKVTFGRIRNCFAEALIIGGSPARAGEFPHMALIGIILPNNDFKLKCGGSLISEKYILTAAHCNTDYLWKSGRPFVRLGTIRLIINNKDEVDDDPEEFNITEFIPHPEYKPQSKYNDIALIKLDRNVKFNKYKRPACLSTQINTNIEKVIASGWGVTEYGNVSSTLQKVTLNKFSYSYCNNYFKNYIKILDRIHICYGSKTERKDTCRGDSGGPIQIRHQSYECMYEIIGITSTGGPEGCGVPGAPAIYTRLYPYIPWIEKTIWN